jgi:hypothetical protein
LKGQCEIEEERENKRIISVKSKVHWLHALLRDGGAVEMI